MDKRVTIKDIAKAAGVSVATVSYVLNNRQDQKISAATRARILQIVSDLGYTGSRNNKPVWQRSGYIAVYSGAENGTLLQSDFGLLLPLLVKEIEQGGFRSLVISSDRCEKISKADAIICIDTPDDTLRRIVQHNSIPVVELNSLSRHPMTVRINVDYSQVMRQAQSRFGFDFCVVTCAPPDTALREHISAQCGSDVYFCSSHDELSSFLSVSRSRPLAVCSTTAFWICSAAGAGALCSVPDPGKLAESAVTAARLSAAGHTPDVRDIFVFR